MRTGCAIDARPAQTKIATAMATDSAWPSAIGMSDSSTMRGSCRLQAERHREQPAHAGIEPVKGAEAGEHEPAASASAIAHG